LVNFAQTSGDLSPGWLESSTASPEICRIDI
jgi:hypothetical protein